MLKFLKDHPFAVEAYFERSLVLTFAIPKEELEGLIPKCLVLDIFEDRWAFLAMALVSTKSLRPKGFPAFMGHDFFLIGYRLFVRYTNEAGKRLRGLYILKSETNKKSMEILGNTFTHYKYQTTDIIQTKIGSGEEIRSRRSDFCIKIDNPIGDIPLPETSPFRDWKEARRYAGPLPFTFSYDDNANEVLIIEGVRQNWTPKPVSAIDYHISFIDSLELDNVILANAFEIRDVPYYWKSGKKEIWQP